VHHTKAVHPLPERNSFLTEEQEAAPLRTPEQSRFRCLRITAVFVAIAIGGVFACSTDPSPPTIRGVRLGMTPEQVRSRFDARGASSWRSEVRGTEIVMIRGPGGGLDRESRFDFHLGMLVAIRLDLPEGAPEAQGPPIESTQRSLVVRSRHQPGRVAVSVLARDCPTHADEVARILARAP
jgi:hypothetical protein